MSRCGCEKEQESQSAHSPGLVVDAEPIVYALVEPETFKNGSLKALRHDRLKNTELSVCRAAHISAVDARKQTVEGMLNRDDSRRDCGFAWLPCSEIRSINLPSLGVGAFCVIDEAYEHFSAHAHVGYSEVNDKKNERQEARGNLLLALQERGYFEIWEGSPFAN